MRTLSFIAEWITNIILFILLATIVDMLLPSSSMQKYVKMVTGLLLILIILTPLFSLFKTDLDQALLNMNLKPVQSEKNLENLIDLKKKEIQASQRAYILETMAVQLESEVEEELVQNEYDLTVQKVNVFLSSAVDVKETVTLDDIQSIEVVLSKETAEPDDVPVVKPVEIDTSKQTEPVYKKVDQTNVKAITKSLSTRWELDSDKIVVTVEGGKES
ncbi:stage III sporulation protein AF [Fredinandcohnia sp. QZ13]|uniref:stage III sporulation protein AF n=1 Tax=Fredinandcohnia sp. QZ13 TaxID=3073144 RepID=UPI002852FBE4|nr:stage III sporulation protein AF [Fredinandcohnia sp. QZ13]MDR4888881.1 stage III sporulation protein AF [Fredinandcohnia sp. QZ13]